MIDIDAKDKRPKTPLLCPLRMAPGMLEASQCVQDKCAWWRGTSGDCVVHLLQWLGGYSHGKK